MGSKIIKEKIITDSLNWIDLVWFNISNKKTATQNFFSLHNFDGQNSKWKNLWSWFLWCLCDSFLWCLRLLYSAFECSAPWCSSPTISELFESIFVPFKFYNCALSWLYYKTWLLKQSLSTTSNMDRQLLHQKLFKKSQ